MREGKQGCVQKSQVIVWCYLSSVGRMVAWIFCVNTTRAKTRGRSIQIGPIAGPHLSIPKRWLRYLPFSLMTHRLRSDWRGGRSWCLWPLPPFYPLYAGMLIFITWQCLNYWSQDWLVWCHIQRHHVPFYQCFKDTKFKWQRAWHSADGNFIFHMVMIKLELVDRTGLVQQFVSNHRLTHRLKLRCTLYNVGNTLKVAVI